MKQCTKCKETKDETEFYMLKKAGRRVAQCNSCRSAVKKVYSQKNSEKLAAYNREWQIAHPESVKAAQKRWQAKNPELAKLRAREWYEENREYSNERERIRGKAIKDAVYAQYGGYVCACCGESNPLFLSLDHINNDGAEHRRVNDVGGKKLYYWLRQNDYPAGFQVLCMNCNWGKARNHGICPHNTSDGSTTSRKAYTQASGSAELLSTDRMKR